MPEKPTIFSDLNLLDYLLAAVFIVIVSLVVNNLMQSYGWAVGIVIALALLYLAKRRRDRLKQPPGKED